MRKPEAAFRFSERLRRQCKGLMSSERVFELVDAALVSAAVRPDSPSAGIAESATAADESLSLNPSTTMDLSEVTPDGIGIGEGAYAEILGQVRAETAIHLPVYAEDGQTVVGELIVYRF